MPVVASSCHRLAHLPARPLPSTVRLVAVAALVWGVGLSGCGTRPTETALAIRSTRWSSDGHLVVSTECADQVRASVGIDHGGSDLAEVTVWGNPRVGRCQPEVEVELPGRDRPAKIVDGTTSMVIDLP